MPILVLAVAAAALGVAAVFLVPAGLPYDEPSHWANVDHLREHWSLPVLGEGDVTYEGQQTPLYYLMAAGVSAVFGGGGAGFVAVRVLGVVGFVLLVVLVATLIRRVTSSRLLVVGATSFIALNPMLIVMSASVQNDTWALTWAFGALVVASGSPAQARVRRGVITGVLLAAAFLTKITVAPIAIAVVVLWLIRRRVAAAAACTVTVVVLTSWWVVRNLLLYGDLTGQAGVDRLGFDFSADGVTGPVDIVRTTVTYLTVPTEYLRNTLRSPTAIDVVALLVAASIVIGGVTLALRTRRECDRWALTLIATAGGLSVAAWLLQITFGWSVAFRTAYGVLPLVALAFACTTQVSRRPWVQAALLAVLLALLATLLVWTGAALVQLDDPGLLTP